MFSKEVAGSDFFLDMPLSSQCLYFHLGIHADDDGFVSPKSIIRLCGAKEDDLGVLLAKGFCIKFQDSVIVLTHWKQNNEIKSDRYKPTVYQEHLKTLGLLENKSYVSKMDTKCIQNVPVGKVSIDKISLVEDSVEKEVAIAPTQFPRESIESKIEIISERLGIPKEKVALEVKKFISYWTEKSINGKKERWEKEKVFDPGRRLTTWFQNIKDKQQSQSSKYSSSQVF